MLSIEPAPRPPRSELQSLLTMSRRPSARARQHARERPRAARDRFPARAHRGRRRRLASLDEMLIVVCERIARELGVAAPPSSCSRTAASCRARAAPRRRLLRRGRVGCASRPSRCRRSPRRRFDSGEPVVARDSTSPLADRLLGSTQLRGPAPCSPVPLGSPPAHDRRAGARRLPRRIASPADDVRLADRARPPRRRPRSSRRSRATSAARTCAPRPRSGGCSRRAPAPPPCSGGRRGAGPRHARSARAPSARRCCCSDEDDRVEHVLTVGADGEFEQNPAASASGACRHTSSGSGGSPRGSPGRSSSRTRSASRLLPAGAGRGARRSSPTWRCRCCPRAARSASCLCSHSSSTAQLERRRNASSSTQLALEGSLVVENAALRATEHERLDELAHQAFHDTLTELPNRALFADRLQHALERMNRRQAVGRGAVPRPRRVQADQRQLRPRGRRPAAGRRRAAASRRALRPEDTVARLGGDEFTVLLEDIADVRYAIAVAERIARRRWPSPFRAQRPRGLRHRQHRDRGQHRSRVHTGRAAAQLRPRDVPGEAQGPRASRGVPRAGHSRARRRRAGRRARPRADPR